jgi:hypothetical protein
MPSSSPALAAPRLESCSPFAEAEAEEPLENALSVAEKVVRAPRRDLVGQVLPESHAHRAGTAPAGAGCAMIETPMPAVKREERSSQKSVVLQLMIDSS